MPGKLERQKYLVYPATLPARQSVTQSKQAGLTINALISRLYSRAGRRMTP